MPDETRDSGISVIGRVPWGTHICQFYKTRQDLIDILVPYFKAGLEVNEFCMWITSDLLPTAEALEVMRQAVGDFDGYLQRGQIEVIPVSEWYMPDGRFRGDRVLDAWIARLEQALAHGYAGLRMSGDTFWVDKDQWEDFIRYEARVNEVIGQYRMLAVCTCCLDRCDGATVIDMVTNHQNAPVLRGGRWDMIESETHRRAREDLARSRQTIAEQADQFVKIMNSMADCIYIVNRQYEIEFVNRAMVTHFGAPRGRKCYQYLHDRDDVCPWCKNEAVWHELQTVSWEWTSEKTGKTYDLVDVPFKNADGSVSKLEVLRDITGRKKVEQALRESERDLNHAQAVANIGSWRLDLPGNRLLWSDETYRIFGVPIGTPMTYEAFLSSVHPEDREYVDLAWTAALRGEPYDIEHRIVIGSEVRWVQERAVLEFDSQGEVAGGFGTVQDITQRKRMENDLRVKEYAIESAITGIAIVDLEGYVTEVNPACLTMWDYGRDDQILGRHATSFFADAGRAGVGLQEALEKGAWQGEARAKRRDGSRFDVEVLASLVTDADGVPLCIMASFIDITERKRLERVRDDFIGLVSHELRTPMTVISGCLSTLLTEWKRLSQEDVRQLMQDALAESQSLAHLVENLLELSRVRSQRLTLYAEAIDTRMLVADTLDKIQWQATSHQFVNSVPDGLPPAKADPRRVERVLYNLLENAAKYSPAGGKIEVSGRTEGGRLVIGVSDQGNGLSPDEQVSVFESFQRLDYSRTAPNSGVGLGLTVCQRLVEAHGGEIWVESEQGRGSTFFFTLPYDTEATVGQGSHDTTA